MRVETFSDTTAEQLGQNWQFGFEPDLMLYFADPDLAQNLHHALRKRAPNATLMGCSSGGQFSRQAHASANATCAAVKFDQTRLKSVCIPFNDSTNSQTAGMDIATNLIADDLAAVFVLSDGMQVNGTELVDGLATLIPNHIPVVGGLAGDGDQFVRTYVGLNDQVGEKMVVAVGLYGDALDVAHGCEGGWTPFGPRRVVTRAEGNVLNELDGKPALDLYERYLGDEAAALPASGLLFPLWVHPTDDEDQGAVRTLLNIDREAKSLIFAGTMQEGAVAQLMTATRDALIYGAAQAATDATSPKKSDSLGLLVSCIGRKLVMGQRAEDEIETVDDHIGQDVPYIGFYSYGEICPRTSGTHTMFHNQTMTISTFSEKDVA